KRYPLAIRLSGKINSIFNDTTLQKPQNQEILLSTTSGSVIVVGNADFATQEAGGIVNMPLIQNLTDWLSLDENLIGVRSRNMIDRSLKNITMKTDSDNSGLRYRIFNIIAMPIILIIFGILIFFHRRRQQYNGGK
ncbi:MAG: hypothetical protein LBH98_04550, partial [Chitinispirillales bacterium]|nr:hypothetical protein [Chitinispirillales bacterium]